MNFGKGGFGANVAQFPRRFLSGTSTHNTSMKTCTMYKNAIMQQLIKQSGLLMNTLQLMRMNYEKKDRL